MADNDSDAVCKLEDTMPNPDAPLPNFDTDRAVKLVGEQRESRWRVGSLNQVSFLGQLSVRVQSQSAEGVVIRVPVEFEFEIGQDLHLDITDQPRTARICWSTATQSGTHMNIGLEWI